MNLLPTTRAAQPREWLIYAQLPGGADEPKTCMPTGSGISLQFVSVNRRGAFTFAGSTLNVFILQHKSHTFLVNIVVPCYNPPEGWEVLMAQRFVHFQHTVSQIPVRLQLTVVNDGSERHVSGVQFEKLRQFIPDVQVISYPRNRGKGYALRQGVAAASEAEYWLVTDADFPYTFESMRRVLEKLLQHGGVVAGNRDVAYYRNVPPARRKLSQALRWMLRHIIRLPVTDSQCGLKGFDRAGRTIFLATTIDRFLYDLEFLMQAGNSGISMLPCPVELREGVVFSKVDRRTLAVEGWNFLKLFLKKIMKI